MEKNYEFKDLSILSEEEKREEITSYFDGIDIPYHQLKVAEYLYNYCRNRGSNMYHYISQIIINNFTEDDLSIDNLVIMIKVFKWMRKVCPIIKNNNDIYYRVFEFCKNNNMTGKYDIKEFFVGIKNLYLYCNCDENNIVFDSNVLLDILDSIQTDEECQNLIMNSRSMEHIQGVFWYLLDEKYPNNQKGLVKTMINCFRAVKQHQRQFDPDFDESDPKGSISLVSFNALYAMAYLYEKLLLNISEKEFSEKGESRFADTFITEFADVYAHHPKIMLHRDIIYNFDDMLQFFKSENLSEEERFSEEELKEFLMNNVRSVFGIDIQNDDLFEKRDIMQSVFDYANTDASERVSIKNLLNTNNASIIYSHKDTIEEQKKLLLGETLGDAYGKDKDPLSENEYRYYLKVLEMKELFSDVAIQNITPESLNKFIRENPSACNYVRCTVIQMMLSKMIDYLYDILGLDDGDIDYTNNKVEKLQQLGIDVNRLITIENLPYLCRFNAVNNMRKEDHDKIWYDFNENVKLLNSYYLIGDIIDMIKYHPEVVFSDHNSLINFAKNNSMLDLYNGLEINSDYHSLS